MCVCMYSSTQFSICLSVIAHMHSYRSMYLCVYTCRHFPLLNQSLIPIYLSVRIDMQALPSLESISSETVPLKGYCMVLRHARTHTHTQKHTHTHTHMQTTTLSHTHTYSQLEAKGRNITLLPPFLSLSLSSFLLRTQTQINTHTFTYTHTQ